MQLTNTWDKMEKTDKAFPSAQRLNGRKRLIAALI